MVTHTFSGMQQQRHTQGTWHCALQSKLLYTEILSQKNKTKPVEAGGLLQLEVSPGNCP